MSAYQVLSQGDQDDITVSFMLSQEQEKYCLELNLQRYEKMLRTLEAGTWRVQIEKLQTDSTSRLAEVNSIVEATKAQMPSAERISAAVARLQASQE